MEIINLLRGDITQQDLLNYYNASISYEDLPDNIRGFVFLYRSIYHIIINKKLTYYLRRKTVLHELAHIELSHLGQFDRDLFAFRIDDCEDEADSYIQFLLETMKND